MKKGAARKNRTFSQGNAANLLEGWLPRAISLRYLHPLDVHMLPIELYISFFCGGPTWVRTRDLPVMSRWLFQLSYGPARSKLRRFLRPTALLVKKIEGVNLPGYTSKNAFNLRLLVG